MLAEEDERVAARTPDDFADRVADAYWMRVSVTGLGLHQEKVTRASLRGVVRDCLDHFTQSDPGAVRDLSDRLDRYEDARVRAGVDRALLEEPSLLLPGGLGPVQGFVEAALGLLPAFAGLLTGGAPLWVARAYAGAHAREVGVVRIDRRRVYGVAALAFAVYWGTLVGLVAWQFSDQATLLLIGSLVPSGLFALTYAARLRSIVAHVGTRAATWFGLGTVAEVRELQSELVGALDDLRNRYRQEVMGWDALPAGSTRRTTRAALGRIAFLTSAVGAVGLFVLSFGDQPIQGLPLGPSPWQETRLVDPIAAEAALLRDAKGVLLAADQLDRMQSEMLVLYREFVEGERDLLTQDDHDAMRSVLISYLDLRSSLLKTVWLYRGENANRAADRDDPTEARAFLTAFAAAVLLVEKAWVIYDTFEDDPTTRDQLDRADAAWGIPEGTWTMLSQSLTNASVMAELFAGVRRFDAEEAAGRLPTGAPWEELATRARASRPAVDAAMDGIGRRRLDRTFASMAEQLRAPRAELTPLVSMAVSRFRFKERPPYQGLISPAQVEALRGELRPGDILIERRNWYISNSLLPGFWPHAALYLGTPEELVALGLSADPRVAPHVVDFDGEDDLGRRFAVIEAIGEGVIFTSLEQSVGEADAVAVLRPNLDEDELREALARALSHRGKEYDFDFDFQTTDRLVCTELIFRTYDGVLDLPPMRLILGQPRLAAVDYVGLWATERDMPDPQLSLVRFLDFDEPNQRAVEAGPETLASTLTRSRFTFVR